MCVLKNGNDTMRASVLSGRHTPGPAAQKRTHPNQLTYLRPCSLSLSSSRTLAALVNSARPLLLQLFQSLALLARYRASPPSMTSKPPERRATSTASGEPPSSLPPFLPPYIPPSFTILERRATASDEPRLSSLYRFGTSMESKTMMTAVTATR